MLPRPWFIPGASILKRVAFAMPRESVSGAGTSGTESLAGLLVQSAYSGMVNAVLVLVAALGLGGIFAVGLFALFAVVDPPRSALMVWRSLDGYGVDQRWVRLEDISPNLIQAVVASEDARFCKHTGIDWRELERAMARVRGRGGDVRGVRGASTISMQVVKNLLLWPGRSLPRKGLELAMTPVMEAIWPKRRILEVYLNIAEWGPGLYGAEAASRVYFGKRAAELGRYEAALLASALPSPLTRNSGRPSRAHRRRAMLVQRRSRFARAYTRCVQN